MACAKLDVSQSGEAGFTLVELLVAMALMLLLGGLMTGGLSFGIRAWERTEQVSEAYTEVEAAQDFLRRTLTNIYPGHSLDRNGQRGPLDFEGRFNEIRYISAPPKQLGEGGYVATRLFVEREGAKKSLNVAWCLDRLSWKQRATGDCRTASVIEGASDIRFIYKTDTDDEALSIWRSTRDIPALIGLIVEFEDGDMRTWPDFLVRPRIDQDAGCRYDPISKRCRGA